MSFIENCVTTSWSAPFCCSGTTLISGSAPITTPAAWIESARVRPSSGCASSMISRRDGIGVDRLAQLAARLQALVERLAGTFRDQLRDLVDDAVGNLEHAARVAHGCARGHRREGDDLRDAVVAVLLAHVVDDALAAFDGEVDVDVGHRLAARVEEPLEHQVVADRVDVGDRERVGDERAGGRAAARADGDAVRLREVDEVPDDQEVVGEAHLLDRLQLVLEALLELGRDLVVAALRGPSRTARRGSRTSRGPPARRSAAAGSGRARSRRCSARRPRACGASPPSGRGSRAPSPAAT